MRSPVLVAALLLLVAAPVAHTAAPVEIVVDPGQVMNRITPWMTGSCIEDVNHEIYGGLYAQLVFGESFEEPPAGPPLAGWAQYGGEWAVHPEGLSVRPDDGAKLVRSVPLIRDGSVEAGVMVEDASSESAGLILRVQNARVGADAWTGYEAAINVKLGTVYLGRHRDNWTLLASAPAPVRPGRWSRLRVDLLGARIRVFLDGGARPLIDFVDPEPILEGLTGVRTWRANARFRNLKVTAAGETLADAMNGFAGAPQVSGLWDAIHSGTATARYAWDSVDAYNSAHSQQVTFVSGAGTVGLANRGLNRWGIALRRGVAYRFEAALKGTANPVIALQSADGATTYASHRIVSVTPGWRRYSCLLRPSASDPAGRLAILADAPGGLHVDQVSLMPPPAARFAGLPVRDDIARALVAEGITFLRYGGSMVNADGYRWKNMIGPRERRPQYRGWWNRHSTNGFGIEEFVAFCRSARIEPAFAINIEETPQDAADLVEYLNGGPATPMGARRVANGHAAPYGVRYIEIGNEEAIDGDERKYVHYLERFRLLADAMHAKDSRLQLVIAAWWRPDSPGCRQIAEALGSKAALWDLHVDADRLADGRAVDGALVMMESRLKAWAPGMKACIFEENGDRHDFQRALSHAHILNVTARHGDFVRMQCPANCLQPLGQNDNGWNQGQLFFTPDRVWGMPPYTVQQMTARNYQPLRVAARASGDAVDVTAARSDDGRTLVVRLVHIGSEAVSADLRVEGFSGARRTAETWTISAPLDAVNTPDDPDHVPVRRAGAAVRDGRTELLLPGRSYTIIRLTR